MPARNEIQAEILAIKRESQDKVRRSYLKQLSDLTGNDVVLYASAFTAPKSPQIPGNTFSITLDDIQGFMSSLHGLSRDSLDLILHSPGGSMEAADQIVQYLRKKYKVIRAIIPQNAMSAATMIACACDVVVMGKHSAIGPIDPQVSFPTSTGVFTAPAQAILDEFEQAKHEVKADKSTIPLWVSRIGSYPHGFLKVCEKTLSLSKEKVATWLAEYMLSSDPDGARKAENIAEWLGDTKQHKTHGRPLCFEQALSHGMRVQILEEDKNLQEAVLSVFHAAMVTFQCTDCVKMIENHEGRGVFNQVQLMVAKA